MANRPDNMDTWKIHILPLSVPGRAIAQAVSCRPLTTEAGVRCRSQWPCGLRRGSTAARLLGLWVRIPPGAWMFVLCLLYKDNSIEHKVTWRTEGFKSTNKKIPGLSMWTNWDWDRFFPENFTFPLSVLFHRCSITRINETINHLYHRVAQWASRLRYVCSICCGALHKKKIISPTVIFHHEIMPVKDGRFRYLRGIRLIAGKHVKHEIPFRNLI